MKTITVKEFDDNFDQIMDDVEKNWSIYIIEMDDGKKVLLSPYIKEMHYWHIKEKTDATGTQGTGTESTGDSDL